MTVRIRELAQRAGVSTQTVSRVLRGSTAVSPAKVALVRAAAAELGYYGNEAARTLKRGRTTVFGLVLPLLSRPFWSEVAAGAVAHAYTHGYTVLLCDTSASPETEADYISILLRHRVAGVLYIHPESQPDVEQAYARLEHMGIPAVAISATHRHMPHPRVRTDDHRAGYVAARHVHDLGRRRFCVVGVDERDQSSQDRIDGAALALQELGTALTPDNVILVQHDISGGMLAGRQIVTRWRQDATTLPDAVFATVDALALGILEVFRGAGLRVPEDIALISHDGLNEATVVVPSLTTIAPPRQEMGRACIDFLLRAGAGEQLPSLCMLEATLIVRESTIGAGPVARHGLMTPISHPEAWTQWRGVLSRGSDDLIGSSWHGAMLSDLGREVSVSSRAR